MTEQIRKGNLVEFTDHFYTNYPPEDTSVIRYGVAIEDSGAAFRECKVKLASGLIVKAGYIHAYGWSGWIPDGLEEIYLALQSYEPPDNSDDYYQ